MRGLRKWVPTKTAFAASRTAGSQWVLLKQYFMILTIFSSSFNYKFKAILFTYVKTEQCFYIATEN